MDYDQDEDDDDDDGSDGVFGVTTIINITKRKVSVKDEKPIKLIMQKLHAIFEKSGSGSQLWIKFEWILKLNYSFCVISGLHTFWWDARCYIADDTTSNLGYLF